MHMRSHAHVFVIFHKRLFNGSKAGNTYWQCAPKLPIHNLVLSTTDLRIVADKVKRKADMIQNPSLWLVASEEQSVKGRADRDKAHPSSQCTVPSSQTQYLFNRRLWSMVVLL